MRLPARLRHWLIGSLALLALLSPTARAVSVSVGVRSAVPDPGPASRPDAPPLLTFEQSQHFARGCKQVALLTVQGGVIGGGEIYCRDAGDDARWYRSAAPSVIHPQPFLAKVTAQEMSNLAALYYGMSDRAGAFAWERRAAERGLAKSMAQVAIDYQSGEGVARDDNQALLWFRKALAAAQATNDQTVLDLVKEYMPEPSPYPTLPAAAVAGAPWPSLLFGTWSGTACGSPATMTFAPGIETTTHVYDTGETNAFGQRLGGSYGTQANVIVVRSKSTWKGKTRYRQGELTPHPDLYEAYTGTFLVRYDVASHKLRGTFRGYVGRIDCSDVILGKASAAIDPELKNLTEADFFQWGDDW